MKFHLILLIFTLILVWIECQSPSNNEGLLNESDYEDYEEMNDGPMQMNTRNCFCGIRKMEANSGKIVGGALVREVYPWSAALLYVGLKRPRLFCAATLINDRYLLTAAHCVDNLEGNGFIGGLSSVRAFLGSNELGSSNGSVFQLISAKIHPRFDPLTLNFDIALIKLIMPLKFKDNIRPVCLKQTGIPFLGQEVLITGWGHLFEGGAATKFQREVKVKVVANNECKKNYSSLGIGIMGNMLCMKSPGKDSCHGDSGGGAFLNKGKSFNQIGIVSFGHGCALARFPGVYTRVSNFIKWIKDNTKDASYCKNSFN